MKSRPPAVPQTHSEVYRSAQEFLPPETDQLSWKEESLGFRFHRYWLHRQTDSFYTYANHMLALPLTGTGLLDWKYEGTTGRHSIQAGRVTIEPAQTFWHRCQWDKMVCLTLHFDPAALARSIHEDFDPDTVRLRGLVNGHDPLLVYLIDLLHREIQSSHRRSLHAQALVARIGAHLLEKHTTSPRRLRRFRQGLSAARLNGVREYLEAHLGENVTLADLAQAAGGLSVFHFVRLFGHALGMSPHQFVLRRRLALASDLLTTGQMTPSEAAAAAGFADQSHLTHALKKHLGITPAQLSPRKARFYKPRGSLGGTLPAC